MFAPPGPSKGDSVMVKSQNDLVHMAKSNPGSLTLDEYQVLAARTINPGGSMAGDLVVGVLGLCGEAGEAAEIVKKFAFHGHPLDTEKVLEEIGDVLWYLAAVATALNIDLSRVGLENINKLIARYPDGFDPKRSLHRKEAKDQIG